MVSKKDEVLGRSKLVFQDMDSNVMAVDKPQRTVSIKEPVKSILPAVTWLSFLMALIVLMVVVGGMTRLTDSGLSIVEWKPISGALFPLSNEKWLQEFEKYKLIPEFILVNSDMTLIEFKYIYYWEWGHRQLGRVIGLVWLIGVLSLALKNNIPRGWKLKFFLIGVLIGFQGLIGWWMVYSGLVAGMIDVASYRLATHLGMAFCIVGFIFWAILSIRTDRALAMVSRRSRDQRLYAFMIAYLITLFFQIILGALVAGIDAGTAYTDWPFMAGEWIPTDYWMLDGFLGNFLENPAAVQFNHRISSYVLFFIGLVTFIHSRRNPINFLKRGHALLFTLLFSQVLLGIVTVVYGAPYQIAIMHQLLALILWLCAIWIFFETAYPRRQILV